jgi:phage terminase small subunit
MAPWALKNSKHEKFALAIADGKTCAEAYVLAGYRANKENATSLAATAEIQSRVSQIKIEAATAAQVSVRRVVTELARIAFADITEAVQTIDGKVVVADSATWNPNLRAAVSEIIQTRDGEIRVKLHSKTQALETLAKHLSMFKDHVDFNVNMSLADLVAGSYKLERGELQLPPPAASVIDAEAQEIEQPADQAHESELKATAC